MVSTYTSPYAVAFKSAIKRGASWNHCVENIAKRYDKNVNVVWQSLYKAGLCFRQKCNGQWIYWPCNATKCNATTCKTIQINFWQSFCEWCICSGFCTPNQLSNHCGSQKEFMTWCRKFFGKQFSANIGTTTKKRSTTKKSYKFPTGRTTKRSTYRRAA